MCWPVPWSCRVLSILRGVWTGRPCAGTPGSGTCGSWYGGSCWRWLRSATGSGRHTAAPPHPTGTEYGEACLPRSRKPNNRSAAPTTAALATQGVDHSGDTEREAIGLANVGCDGLGQRRRAVSMAACVWFSPRGEIRLAAATVRRRLLFVGSIIWGPEVAEVYDKTYAAQSATPVLGPIVDLLAELARGGPVLEFAVGTGRVALPLAARGIAVAGIELSPHIAARMLAKPGAGAVP